MLHFAFLPVMKESYCYSYLCQSVVFPVFWSLAVLIDVQWYFYCFFIYVMIYDLPHPFLYLAIIHLCFLGRCLLRILTYFKIRFLFVLSNFQSSLCSFQKSVLKRWILWKYFFWICSFPLSYVTFNKNFLCFKICWCLKMQTYIV